MVQIHKPSIQSLNFPLVRPANLKHYKLNNSKRMSFAEYMWVVVLGSFFAGGVAFVMMSFGAAPYYYGLVQGAISAFVISFALAVTKHTIN